MGISYNKYIYFKELNRNVIVPAVKEINQKSDIHLEINYKKVGRAIIGLKFYISDNSSYLPKFKRKEKKLSETALNIKKVLVHNFKLNENDAQYIIERYETNFIRSKLDEICRSSNYKNNKIYNLGAYINSILETENQLKTPKTLLYEDNINAEQQAEKPKAFSNKYTKYKITTLIQELEKHGHTFKEEMYSTYKIYLQQKKSVLLRLFLQKGLDSPLVSTDFLIWMMTNCPEYIPKFLTYDEFITEEAIIDF